MKRITPAEMEPSDTDGYVLGSSSGQSLWLPPGSLIDAEGLFKGAWQTAPDELVWEQDFDTDLVPFTGTGIRTSMATAVGTSKPSAYLYTDQGSAAPIGGAASNVGILNFADIPELVGRTPTRLKCWNAQKSVASANLSRTQSFQILRNGTAVYSDAITTNNNTVIRDWTERELVAGAGDTFTWRIVGATQTASVPTGTFAFTAARIYAALVGWTGYKENDHVVYNGQLYKSTIDSNNSVPGVNTDWTLIPWYKTPKTPNSQVAAYVLGINDSESTVIVTNAGAVALTIPADSTVNFPIGTRISFIQGGAGVVTATPASGVTLNGSGATTAQWNRRWLEKTAANTWVCTT